MGTNVTAIPAEAPSAIKQKAVFSVLALHEQIAPPTINLVDQDPQCDLDYVPNSARGMKITVVVSNSFGFGGTNGSLVFRAV